MNDKYKTLSGILFGIVVGLGYAVACGSESDSGGTASGAAGSPTMLTPGMMNLPGVGVALAQGTGTTACAQWEVREFRKSYIDDNLAGFTLPEGWIPFGGDAWAMRCAQ